MSDMAIDITCPNCSQIIKVKIKNMYSGNSIVCDCGQEIEFSGGDGRKAQKAFDDLHKSMKKLSRKITIKF